MEGPDQNFWCVGVFLSKVCQKIFSRSGTPKIDDFGPFFKNGCPKYLLGGKNVFFVLPIFSKNRGNGGLFLGVRPKMFFTKLDKCSAACV